MVLVRQNTMDPAVEIKDSAGDEKYHSQSVYKLSNEKNGEDENGMILLSDE